MDTEPEMKEEIREFYTTYFRSTLKTIIKQNHRFKIQSIDKIGDLLEKAIIKADADIGVMYSGGVWLISGDESEFLKIPLILKFFKKMYRHSKYEKKYDMRN